MPLIVDLTSLTDEEGFEIDGGIINKGFTSATTTCDLDGDGIDEIISGAPSRVLNSKGAVYVLWSGFDGPPPNLTTDIISPRGFNITSANNGDFLGSGVACVDMNQDGYLDIVIGAPGASPGGKVNAGGVYVIFQYGLLNQTNIDLSTFPLTSTAGFFIDGENANDQFGFSIANGGDVNGDGFADLVVGAPYASSNNGNAYVINSQPGMNALALASLDTTTGFKLLGTPSSTTGWAVSSGGDMNGDGFAEVLIGAKRQGGSNKGAVYIVFGKPSRATPVNLATPVANDLVRIDGTIGDQPRSGWSVDKLNFNGDQYSDIIFGAPFANSPNTTQPGVAYVVYGKANFPSASIQIAALSTSDGFPLYGVAQYSTTGYCVTSGDLNGDGLDDILITTPGRSSGKGGAYVYYGKLPPTPSATFLAGMNDVLGYQMVGNTNSWYVGSNGCAIGNIRNNTRLADVLIGGPLATQNGLVGSGVMYGVYSSNTPALLATDNNGNLAFVANQPIVIDSGITITDIDNLYINSAQVKISSGFSSGDILSFVNQNGITGTYDAATGTLTLSGTATLANYQAALRTVIYQGSDSSVDRTISFVSNESNVITRTLFALEYLLSGSNNQLMCFNKSNEKLLFPQLSIAGSSTLTLQNATVTIADFVASEETLEFTDLGNNVTASFDNGTGILTLTGPALASEFEATLQTVKYINSNNASSISTKTFSTAVNYAGQSSNTLQSQFDLIAVNDAPLVINPVADFNVTADEPFSLVLGNNTFNLPDAQLNLSVLGENANSTSVSFDSNTRQLNGTLPVGQNRFGFFASDICNQTAASNFTINAFNPPVTPALAPVATPVLTPLTDSNAVPTMPVQDNTGPIVGGIVGGIAGLVILGGAIFGGIWAWRKKQAKKPTDTAASLAVPNTEKPAASANNNAEEMTETSASLIKSNSASEEPAESSASSSSVSRHIP